MWPYSQQCQSVCVCVSGCANTWGRRAVMSCIKMDPNTKLTRAFPSLCPYSDPRYSRKVASCFFKPKKWVQLSKDGGCWMGEQRANKQQNQRGKNYFLLSWNSLANMRRVSQPQNSHISGTSTGSSIDMQGQLLNYTWTTRTSHLVDPTGPGRQCGGFPHLCMTWLPQLPSLLGKRKRLVLVSREF